ncbi:hypothetical protein BKA59DRAFT_127323 [Fusarium tricinctum]|uniref:Uncharacterized protein n=1 Tax=Fusarium tricinctum TaxID=61284 RepID=A0A8K0WEC0_9HYPO|nr:hypothetical protein BKA59DRAFT_127323 [Fusarium tricinctum]
MNQYNLRPRPVQKPTIFRFLNEERFPTFTQALDACPEWTDPTQNLPDSSYHPPNSADSTTVTSGYSTQDSLSEASSTDIWGLEVITPHHEVSSVSSSDVSETEHVSSSDASESGHIPGFRDATQTLEDMSQTSDTLSETSRQTEDQSDTRSQISNTQTNNQAPFQQITEENSSLLSLNTNKEQPTHITIPYFPSIKKNFQTPALQQHVQRSKRTHRFHDHRSPRGTKRLDQMESGDKGRIGHGRL